MLVVLVGKNTFKGKKSQLYLVNCTAPYDSVRNEQAAGIQTKEYFLDEETWKNVKLNEKYNVYFNDRGYVEAFILASK